MAVTWIITPVLQKAEKTANFPRDWRLPQLKLTFTKSSASYCNKLISFKCIFVRLGTLFMHRKILLAHYIRFEFSGISSLNPYNWISTAVLWEGTKITITRKCLTVSFGAR